LLVFGLTLVGLASTAADWPRFRGPNGSATSEDKNLPTQWGAEKNIVWKTALPGHGTSSPITVGDKVFVTCFSGYMQGSGRGNAGDITKLKRHLVCCDRATGNILWEKEVAAKQPEDQAVTQITEHGYASHTPTTDGKRVYVMFGKTGVLAFDMSGEQVWQTSVGTGSAAMGWGSAASPILYKHLLIVNASAERRELVALDTATGTEVWKASIGNNATWSTPILVDVEEGKQDLVLSASDEIWGLNPDTGKLRWYAEGFQGTGRVSPSPVAKDGVVYAINAGPGGRGGGMIAVKAGGKGDVTKTHVLWTGNLGSYSTSPVVYEGHVFWADDRGMTYCVNAASGEKVYSQQRLDPSARKVYSSMLAADGKLYLTSCNDGTYVLEAKPEFKQLAHNTLDDSLFNACPAVSNGQLLIRSNKFLYCIGNKP